ncbi:MAG: POTRA domain-containing protein, partial [Myxococcota bacterium]
MFWTLTTLILLGSSGESLEVEGNVLFNRYVYTNVAGLPEGPYDAEVVKAVESRVLEFLRRSGYTLARVEGRIENGGIVLEVDEGKLRRIRLLGRGTFETLGLRMDLQLPYDIFNRPALEERLAAVDVPEGEDPIRYEVIDVENAKSNLALDTLALVPGVAPVLLPEDGHYELRVYLPSPLFGGGLRLTVGADSDGLLSGLRYRDQGLLFHDDRWELRGQAGVNFFQEADGSGSEFAFSRVTLGGGYWFPDFLEIRPKLEFTGDYVLRQRLDIGLQNYWWARVTSVVGLAYSIDDFAEIE